MRIHVTEEARHLSFARHYLKRALPSLNAPRRAALALGAPVVLGVMADMMLKPPSQLVARNDIPKQVIRALYTDNDEHHAATPESLAKVRKLCDELGLLRPPFVRLWRLFRLVRP